MTELRSRDLIVIEEGFLNFVVVSEDNELETDKQTIPSVTVQARFSEQAQPIVSGDNQSEMEKQRTLSVTDQATVQARFLEQAQSFVSGGNEVETEKQRTLSVTVQARFLEHVQQTESSVERRSQLREGNKMRSLERTNDDGLSLRQDAQPVASRDNEVYTKKQTIPTVTVQPRYLAQLQQPESSFERRSQLHEENKIGSAHSALGDNDVETEKQSIASDTVQANFLELGHQPESLFEENKMGSLDRSTDGLSLWQDGQEARKQTAEGERLEVNERNGWDEDWPTEAEASSSSPELVAPESLGWGSCPAADYVELGYYDQEILLLGKNVPVRVAYTAKGVEDWIRQYSVDERQFGIDIEWRPNHLKGDDNKAALFQIAGVHGCLIVQLLYIDCIPDSLRVLLADPEVKLAGVGVHSDSKKLFHDYGLQCRGEVDLGLYAADVLNIRSLKRAGLATLCTEVLEIPFKKNKSLTVSNWAVEGLSLPQITYAASDACIAYSVLIILNKKSQERSIAGSLPSSNSKSTGHDPGAGDIRSAIRSSWSRAK